MKWKLKFSSPFFFDEKLEVMVTHKNSLKYFIKKSCKAPRSAQRNFKWYFNFSFGFLAKRLEDLRTKNFNIFFLFVLGLLEMKKKSFLRLPYRELFLMTKRISTRFHVLFIYTCEFLAFNAEDKHERWC